MAVETVAATPPVLVNNGDPLNPILSCPDALLVRDAVSYVDAQRLGIPWGGLRSWLDFASGPFTSVVGPQITELRDRIDPAWSLSTLGSAPDADVLNGRQAAEFDGDGLIAASAGAMSFLHMESSSGFAVMRRDPGGGVIPTVLANMNLGGFGSTGFALRHEGAGPDAIVVGQGGGAGYCIFLPFAIPDSTWCVVSWTLELGEPTADRAHAWIDGVDTGAVNTGDQAASGSGTADGNMQIGEAVGGSGALIGGVAEILLYSRVLPDADRIVVEGYLATKWGL
jgi:hypothetical protein